ncbi:acyltransferase family protein [Winogradskyella sp. PE311]|uniref:acyltransferase family protein n=1 Tax=Winogradskyella sp. PE311 TaxID=3366943 RepID=UPI0039806561
MDILRAVGILLVVLRHSFSPYRGSWGVSQYFEYNIYADYLGSYISTFSMPLFVFISGYIYHFLRSNYGKYGNYKTLFYKKSRRLIVPYFILAPIYIYFFLDYNNFGSYLAHLWTDSGHLWFLLMMFIMFMIYYKFEDYLNKKIVFGIVLGSFLYIISVLFLYYNLQPIGRVFRYFIFFLLGNYFSKNSSTILNYLKGKVLYIFLAHLAIFSLYFYFAQTLDNKYLLITNRQALLVISILALCFVYGFLNIVVEKYKSSVEKIKPLTKLINHTSYYIYLIHQPILKVYFTFLIIQGLSPTIGIIIAFLGSMLISISLGYVIMKFKWGRELIGSK